MIYSGCNCIVSHKNVNFDFYPYVPQRIVPHRTIPVTSGCDGNAGLSVQTSARRCFVLQHTLIGNNNKEENTIMKTKFSTSQLVILGLMTAILLLMAYTPLGYLNIGPLAVTFNVIPVAVAAITLGPAGDNRRIVFD